MGVSDREIFRRALAGIKPVNIETGLGKRPECPRHCLACGHRTMGAGEPTMQCSRCTAWDWGNMDPETERFVRRLDMRERLKAERKRKHVRHGRKVVKGPVSRAPASQKGDGS